MGFKATETLARWTSKHPWATIGAWVAVLVAAIMLTSTLLGGALTTEARITNNPESKQANDLIQQRLGNQDDSINEMVIVRSDSYTVDTPEYKAYAEGLFAELMALQGTVIEGGVTYYMTNDPSLVSADRKSMIIPLVMQKTAKDQVGKLHDVVDNASGKGAFQLFVTGDATVEEELMAIGEKDAQRGEVVGIGAALVVLAIVFGALVAAVLPLILGMAAVALALGAAALVGQAMDLTFFVTNIITMMGLAVGIDYSLFVVSRYREERANGLSKHQAIVVAGGTASKAVLFSGMTVVLALCGLVLFPLSIFQSIGIGAILVVVAAVVACLTLLPAVLSLLGDKVNTLRLRIPMRRARASSLSGGANGGFWTWTTHAVMRRPLLFLVVAGGLLVALGTPFLDLDKGFAGVSTIPDGTRSKAGFTVLQEEFGYGQDTPAVIVIDSPTDSAALNGSLQRLTASLESDPEFMPMGVQSHPEADLTILYARLAGDPMGKAALDAVEKLRAQYIPQAFGGSGIHVFVAGGTAEVLDFNATTDTYTPIIFAFVLGLSFVLLTVAFRSIVVPVTSIIMNMLSVGAAYGLLVLVFQKGVGASILGFQKVDAIESWLPLFLFSVLFGLSMDYHVFLLSRIKERHDHTRKNSESVAFGLQSTGRLITGAALIMVMVFSGFALGKMVMMQEMGFGLAVAVLVDATVVRSVLVPATMRLLGEKNWYLPKWLAWIPSVGIGEGAGPEPASVGGPLPCPKPVPVVVPVRND